MYQELRLALVFNGGVSLAVWMGGVAKEIDRFRTAFARAGSPEIEPYRALLGYAVANGKSLECAGLVPDTLSAKPKFAEPLVDAEKGLANTFFGLRMKREGELMRAATRATGVMRSALHVFTLGRHWFKRQR